jgi:hypothetical protein
LISLGFLHGAAKKPNEIKGFHPYFRGWHRRC